MGLDAVEIVLRAEELYRITIADDEAAGVRTVGDFYSLVCTHLGVAPLADPQTPVALPVISALEPAFLFLKKHRPLPAPAEVLPWSSQSVWDTLVAVLVDQQGLKPGQVLYGARFVEDLWVD